MKYALDCNICMPQCMRHTFCVAKTLYLMNLPVNQGHGKSHVLNIQFLKLISKIWKLVSTAQNNSYIPKVH